MTVQEALVSVVQRLMGETSAISHPDFKLCTEASHHLSFELLFYVAYVACALLVEIFGSWCALEIVKRGPPGILFKEVSSFYLFSF